MKKLFFALISILSLSCLISRSDKGIEIKNIEPAECFIQYLGSEGFLIKKENITIVTAPFYSNPLIPELLAGNMKPNKKVLKKYGSEIEDADIILIGHAHYDHLMDIPYLAEKYAKKALIYGSVTAKNILLAELPEHRIIALNSPLDNKVATYQSPGQWIYYYPPELNSNYYFRFLAIKSSHAAHIGTDKFNYKLFSGTVDQPLTQRPRIAEEWKEGQTLAYLLDFLNLQDQIVFRILFQDSVSSEPLGLPMPSVLQEKSIDVCILCVPTYDKVNNYPEYVIQQTNPHIVFLGHWEDFFIPYSRKINETFPVPFSFQEIFIERLNKVLPSESTWILPQRGACFIYHDNPGKSQSINSN